MTEAKSQGFMYMAKRPCGKVSAMAWDKEEWRHDTAKSVAEWRRRGDEVVRVERFVGDPAPEMICRSKCADCKAPTGDSQSAPSHPSAQRSGHAALRDQLAELARVHGGMAVVNAALAVNEALAGDPTRPTP